MAEIKMSIVEPYWKRGKALRRQFDNYLRWYAERDDIEIIVVDDGSPVDQAAPIVAEYQDKFACDLRLIQMPIKEGGKDNCVVYNLGVSEARGEWLFLTQTDIIHTEDTFALLISAVDGILPEHDVALYPCCYCTERGFRSNQHTPGCAPDGITMRKSLYERLGGFNEEFRDGYAVSDLDFRYKLEEGGVRVFSLVDVLLTHVYEEGESWEHDEEGWQRNNRILARGRDPYELRLHVYPKILRPGIAVVHSSGLAEGLRR